MSILDKLTEGIVSRDLRKEGEALLGKWERTGLLEGLSADNEKEGMARLLENQAKQLLKEASSMEAGNVEGFASVAFPLVERSQLKSQEVSALLVRVEKTASTTSTKALHPHQDLYQQHCNQLFLERSVAPELPWLVASHKTNSTNFVVLMLTSLRELRMLLSTRSVVL